jgi:hypothetical protein
MVDSFASKCTNAYSNLHLIQDLHFCCLLANAWPLDLTVRNSFPTVLPRRASNHLFMLHNAKLYLTNDYFWTNLKMEAAIPKCEKHITNQLRAMSQELSS